MKRNPSSEGPSLLSPKAIRELVKVQLEEMNTPRSLSIFLILQETDKGQGAFDDEIFNLKVSPFWFQTAASYVEFAHPTDLVKKMTNLKLSWNPTSVARDSFLEAEARCRDTNRRIKHGYSPIGRIGDLLSSMRKMVAELLPPITPEFLDSLIDCGGWGAGVTSSVKGRWLSQYHKLMADQHATPAFLPIASALVRETNGWSGNISVRPYNKVGFVPKTAKTDRAIAVEPSLNAFVQRAVGKKIRSALLKWGINLHSQEKNRDLALIGSRDGTYATLDLSAASDTISIAVVREILPPSWYWLLSILRSEFFMLDNSKELIRYEKFSSMGNGFTFELETLIFSSVCRAIVGKGELWSVYGDDIIVPTPYAAEVANLLDHLGFVVNQNKSYVDGPFRESCGGDYFLGEDVRGFYLKEIKVDTPFVWANWLREKSRFPFSKTWKSILHQCRRFATFVPKGNHGLLGFHADPGDSGLSHWLLERRPYGPVQGVMVEGWVFTPQKLDLKKEVEASMVIANLRFLVAKEATDCTHFAITASGNGKWRRRRKVISDDIPWLRGI